MMTRKEMKKRAKRALKNHYFIYVAICLVAAYLGSEFDSSLERIGVQPVSSAEYSATYEVSVGGLKVNQGMADVIDSALSGRVEEGRELSRALEQQAIENAKHDNPAFGRSRGVFAHLLNAMTSGTLLVTVISTVNSVVGSNSVTMALFIGMSFLLPFLLWFFLKNIFVVISRRMFLEGRHYEKLPIQRFVFLLRVRRWLKTCWTMCVVSIFKLLWTLTIVGGLIKHYSYFLVPYIVAENPDIGTLQAITLSRRMMKGHKWQCFVCELSFIGWGILGLITFGVSDIAFSNPYQVAFFTEYYVRLRQQALDNEIENAVLLNDRYLYENASRDVLYAAYMDVIKIMEQPVETLGSLGGIRGFLAEWFGILVTNTKKEIDYENGQARQLRIASLKDAVEGLSYPGRLFSIPEEKKLKKMEMLHYMRNYSIWSLLLMFFIFSGIGWLWEVCLHLVSYGEFVNRGVLHGPWLPIYGSGGVLILTVLKKFREHPVQEFAAAVVLCGAVEYATSYVLEITHDGKRWWDYSGYFLNLNGRICAEGLLIFGIGGVMVVYVLAPMLDNWIRKMKLRVVVPLCLGLLCVFLADQAYSSKHPNAGDGITSDMAACGDRLPGKCIGQTVGRAVIVNQ